MPAERTQSRTRAEAPAERTIGKAGAGQGRGHGGRYGRAVAYKDGMKRERPAARMDACTDGWIGGRAQGWMHAHGRPALVAPARRPPSTSPAAPAC
eukprot:356929-Chlamydomonas_euryale.AAC.3